MTLRDALELYFKHAHDLAPRSRTNLRHAINVWERFGCERRIASITTDTFATFRSAAVQAKLSETTVENVAAKVVTLLRHCGPVAQGVPHGRGLIPAVPYTGRPLKIVRSPRPAPSLDALSAVYACADQATYPRRLHVPAPVFWRGFFATAYNTALRFGDLQFSLLFKHVDLAQKSLTVTASKTGKTHCLPVNPVLARHLELLRGSEDGRLFPLPRCRTAFYAQLRRLCAAAGVEPFTPQAIRRRAASEFEKAHAGAGALVLGHSLGVTFAHYISAFEVLYPVAGRLPQPAAFLEQT